MTASTSERADRERVYNVVCIAGPTGSGKSALAMRIAQELNGEIVNCDSLQVYRGFDIGTAKPSVAERQLIRHHLVDVADPASEYSAGEFARQARNVVHILSDRKTLPVVAGGTGFYFKALIDGLVPAPRRNSQLRERLASIELRRPGKLHAILRGWDRQSASRIQPADVQKLVRALEVMLERKQTLSSLYGSPREGAQQMRFLQIGLDPPREQLYRILNARCEAMWLNGLVEEVQGLLRQGCSEDAKPFGAIGYKQALQVLRGELKSADALAEMQRDTRRYAKRQWTWFRRDKRIFWFPGFGGCEHIHAQVVLLLYKRLFWY